MNYICNCKKANFLDKSYTYWEDRTVTTDELDIFVNNIFDTIIGDPEADVEVYADSDTDHRYITVNILDKVLH